MDSWALGFARWSVGRAPRTRRSMWPSAIRSKSAPARPLRCGPDTTATVSRAPRAAERPRGPCWRCCFRSPSSARGPTDRTGCRSH